MRTDFHFYLLYYLGVKAGLKPQHAYTIAYAAEYVDDNTSDQDITFADGSSLSPTRTAYREWSLMLISKDKQLKVYLPFHFFPSGQGNHQKDKLKSHAHAQIMRDLKIHVLSCMHQDFALHYLGVYLHIFIDTSIHEEVTELFDNKGRAFNTDLDLECIDTFIASIYHLLSVDIRHLNPTWFEGPAYAFDTFKPRLEGLMNLDLTLKDRIESWKDAFFNGSLGMGLYQVYQPHAWQDTALIPGQTSKGQKTFHRGDHFSQSDWVLFQKAIKAHLSYCQDVLFPKYKIAY